MRYPHRVSGESCPLPRFEREVDPRRIGKDRGIERKGLLGWRQPALSYEIEAGATNRYRRRRSCTGPINFRLIPRNWQRQRNVAGLRETQHTAKTRRLPRVRRVCGGTVSRGALYYLLGITLYR